MKHFSFSIPQNVYFGWGSLNDLSDVASKIDAKKASYGFLWAVQWHPEFSYKTDENSKKIFRAFVESLKVPS